MRLSPNLMTASLLALLSACAVGPDYARPDLHVPSAYDSESLADKTASGDGADGIAQKMASGQDIPAAWWELFHSEDLNRLIVVAIKNNPDIEAAKASLRAAEEASAAQRGVLFPSVDGNFSTVRQKTSGASSGGVAPSRIFTLNNASVSVSYGFDLFGLSRREVEQIESQEAFQRFQTEGAYLTLTANVVTTAVQEASLRGQIAATQKVIEEEGKVLDLLRQQYDAGAITESAILAQEATVAQTKATLPALEKQRAVTRHQLSALMGQFPSDAPDATFDLDHLHLPETLPVSLPSQLVDQRPDIRAAEASLQEASAAVGVSIGARLPRITLTSTLGSSGNGFDKLLTPASEIWSAGFAVTEPLFDAGTLWHQERAAKANYDVAKARYRKTVLAAFQDVADSLRALQSDAESLKAQQEASQAAEASLELARTQFKAGAISAIALLNAEQAATQSQITLVQAEARRFADTAALFQALGGGWWNRKDEGGAQ